MYSVYTIGALGSAVAPHDKLRSMRPGTNLRMLAKLFAGYFMVVSSCLHTPSSTHSYKYKQSCRVHCSVMAVGFVMFSVRKLLPIELPSINPTIFSYIPFALSKYNCLQIRFLPAESPMERIEYSWLISAGIGYRWDLVPAKTAGGTQ